MPDYVRAHLGGSDFEAGLAVTIGFIATMVSRPIAGRIADKQGARRVALTGALLAAAGGIGHLLSADFRSLIFARLLLGAGEGALFTASIGWVLAEAPAERRGRIAGRFGLSMWGGLTCGPILGTILVKIGGFHMVWIAASLLPATGFFVLRAARHYPQVIASRVGSPLAWLPRGAWGPGASYFFASIGYGVLAACLTSRMLALSLAGHDFALAIFGCAFLAARFVGSPLVDRIGATVVLAAFLLAEAAGLLGLAIASTALTTLLMTAITGGGLAIIYPCYVALVTKAADARERTTAIGMVISAWDLGVAVGGPMAGLLAANHYSSAFMAAACAAVISLLILMLLRKRGHITSETEDMRAR